MLLLESAVFLHTSQGDGALHGTTVVYLKQLFICIIQKQGLEIGIATAKSQPKVDQHVQKRRAGFSTILHGSQIKRHDEETFVEDVWIEEIGISLVLARGIQQKIKDLVVLLQV